MKVILVFMVLGLILLSGCSHSIEKIDNSNITVISHPQIDMPVIRDRTDRLKNPIINQSTI